MSSFRKRVVSRPITGTRTSPHTGQVIISSGNPSLDVLLGGGLPVGSICLIEEDKFVTYSKVLAKYFMADGVSTQHSLFLASLDDSPKELLKKLPQQCSEVVKEEGSPEAADENKLRIAWRYNDLPMVNSNVTNETIGHNFNLMEFMDPSLLRNLDIVTWPDSALDDENVAYQDEKEHDCNMKNSSSELESDNYKNDSTTSNPSICVDENQDISDDKTATASAETSATSSIPLSCLDKNTKFNHLLKDIHNKLSIDKLNVELRRVCRVCITSLGSPQWYDESFGAELLKFLTILRAIIRSNISVCFITMPMHLVAKYDATLVPRIRNLVDYSIELESFAGSGRKQHPAFKEYNGLLRLHRIAAVNTLCAYMPETTDLGFKLKRKSFVIEKLHLPPELQDDNATDKKDAKSTLSCGTAISRNQNVSMDF